MNYLVQFYDGDHAWSEGRDGIDAARKAERRWKERACRVRIGFARAGRLDAPIWQRVPEEQAA